MINLQSLYCVRYISLVSVWRFTMGLVRNTPLLMWSAWFWIVFNFFSWQSLAVAYISHPQSKLLLIKTWYSRRINLWSAPHFFPLIVFSTFILCRQRRCKLFVWFFQIKRWSNVILGMLLLYQQIYSCLIQKVMNSAIFLLRVKNTALDFGPENFRFCFKFQLTTLLMLNCKLSINLEILFPCA